MRTEVSCRRSIDRRSTRPSLVGGFAGARHGIDHPLDVDWSGTNSKVDGDGWKDAPEPKPHTMPLQTGTTAQILDEGLPSGGTSDKEPFTGRLQQGSFFSPSNRYFAGEATDNQSL